ncbi:MAG: penicillin amidase [Psychrobacter glaciei]|jgi:penicillin amidase
MSILSKSLKYGFTGLAIIGVTASMWVWHKLPVRSGELTLNNLSANADILFDEWGIPHIYADQDLDGFRALGFVHGQDRLLQMDLLRRVGNGNLSELIGEKAIKVDKTFRTFGTHLIAEKRSKILRQTQPLVAAKVDAYYDGVNQAIDQLPAPIEYSLLGAKPQHFKLEDAYGIAAYMAHSFLTSIKTDPLLTAIQQTVSAEHFSDIVIGWPVSVTTTPNTGASQVSPVSDTSQTSSKNICNNKNMRVSQESLLALIDAGQAIAKALPFGVVHGSNGWVISADKSKGDFPIFANDPHMQFSTPAIWYEAQLKTNKRNIYGHFAAGVPFPLLMRSKQRIHGLTMLQSDDADLLSLTSRRLPAKDTQEAVDQVMIEGNWESVVSRNEIIKVKGQSPVEFKVRTTSLGPIINDLLKQDSESENQDVSDEPTDASQENAEQIVFYWVFTDPKNDVVLMMHNVMEANDLQAMESAVAPHMSPGLNILYADRDNNMAMWAAGRFIKRHPGQTGKTIVNGSQDNSIPMGVYPFSENPKIINPESGYIFSTNNPYPNSQPDFKHAGYYAPIYRAIVADNALLNHNEWTVEKSQALQTSTHNTRWTHVKPALMSVLNMGDWNDLETQAIARLSAWNGEYKGSAIAASIFERFYFNLMSEIYLDEIGEKLFDKFVTIGIADNTLYQLINQPDSIWWDNIQTNRKESQADIFSQAFVAAIVSLEAEFGGNSRNWTWQVAAELTHPHPLGKVWPLNHMFNVGEFVVNGSKRALNNMIHTFIDEKIHITNGPSTRRVVDLEDMANGWNINPVGQSGRWLDKHYASQSELYHNNQYRRSIMLNADDSRAQNMEHLVLRPKH